MYPPLMSLERPHTLATSEQAKTPNDEIQPGPRRWHSWSWLLIPLFAVVAYATVLRLGFISDDLVLLYQARQTGIDTGIFIPQAHWFLYRPLGTFLVWQLGWSLWGYNPFPFHFLSLFFHASTSLLFGL